MMLVDGVETDRISVIDRGFQYGDGLFETIEVLFGRPIFLEQHLLRLFEGCARLNIPKPDIKQLTDEINYVCKQVERAVLKIIITRGIGGRGYRQPEVIQSTRAISLYPFPEYPSSYAKQGVTARFCATSLGLNPALAGIKHLNRLEQVMARAEWDDPEIQEGIMLDINNHVIEGTMTNLFYVKDNITYTAMLTLAGVAGIIRGFIKTLVAEHNLSLIEHQYDKETLLNADEIFVCNSIIGIWPVRQIEDIRFTVGNVTSQLQTWLMLRKKQGLVDAT